MGKRLKHAAASAISEPTPAQLPAGVISPRRGMSEAESDRPVQSKAGRKGVDVVTRLRVSMWAHDLWRRSEMTYGHLDALLLPQGPASQDADRERIMRKAVRFGVIPPAKPGSERDVVAAGERHFPGSSTNYRHEVWDLLMASDTPSENRVKALSKTHMDRLGLHQPRFANVAAVVCGPGFPACPGDLDAIRKSADAMAENVGLDALMILALQSRLAVLRSRFGEAQIYLDALARASKAFDDSVNLPQFNGFLYCLLVRRVIHNDRSDIDFRLWPDPDILGRQEDEEDDQNDSAPQKGKKEALRMKRWYWERSQVVGPLSLTELRHQPGTPIVEQDERLLWLESHWSEIFGELMMADQHGLELSSDLLPTLNAAADLWSAGVEWKRERFTSDSEAGGGGPDWREPAPSSG